MSPSPTGEPELPADLLLPRYGSSTLADLLPSIGAHLGVPGCEYDNLSLPSAQRYVLLLVDGLGDALLRRSLQHTEYFAEVYGDATALTSGVPSTTATSITCLGTGLPPGRHGMAGYSFRCPGTHRAMNALTWEGGPQDVAGFQPRPTMLQRMADAGVAVTSTGPAHFENSGLTTSALRGADFVGHPEAQVEARVHTVVESSRRGDHSLVYVYERQLDHTGHGKGVASPQWLQALAGADRLAGRLREALDDDVCLLVTGDHGMVDVPAERHVVVEDHPRMLRAVDLLAGEGRMRQLWTASPDKVADTWQDELQERAVVRTREQAVAEGWFGPLDPALAGRFGDVLVAMRQDWAVMTRALPGEMELVGQHGSLTPAELQVPLLVDHPASW